MPDVLEGGLPLLSLLRHAHKAADPIALDFIVVNDSFWLAEFRQAALWLRATKVSALSGVASVERNAPYAQWLHEVCLLLAKPGSQEPFQRVDASQVPGATGAAWREWLPAYGLWVPLRLPKHEGMACPGGVLFARDEPWTDAEASSLSEWVGYWALMRHQLAPLGTSGLWRKRAGKMKRRWRTGAIILLLLAGAFLIQVPISVLAPAELVPADPMPVRAPIDGVVRQFFVQPNQLVKAGDPLFAFDVLQLASRLQVARQSLESASAELRQYDQQALYDPKARAALAAARGNVAEKRAEVDYLTNQRSRSTVLAPEDGVAIFDEAQDWIGRPVNTGERILRLASERSKEIEAWVSVADAIPLEAKAPVRLYLSSSPLDPVEGAVRYVANDATRRPDGSYAYRLRATLTEGTTHRIGLKGTARLSGPSVSFAYWMFRRPLAALREFFGL